MTRKIETDLNDLEQYGRRFNIRIFGLSLANEEDCKEKVATLVSESLGISSFAADDIEAAHPLPVRKVNSASSGTQRQTASLIVRLRSKSTREQILQKRKQLKGTGISIAEDLTSLNVNLLNRLHNDERISDSWSMNGKIYCKFKNCSKKFNIRPFQYLDNLDNFLKSKHQCVCTYMGCTYACVCVGMRVRMGVCMHVCAIMCMYVGGVCMYVCVLACVPVCMHVCLYDVMVCMLTILKPSWMP